MLASDFPIKFLLFIIIGRCLTETIRPNLCRYIFRPNLWLYTEYGHHLYSILTHFFQPFLN